MSVKAALDASAAEVLRGVLERIGPVARGERGGRGGRAKGSALRRAAVGVLSLDDAAVKGLEGIRGRPEVVNSLSGEWADPVLLHLLTLDEDLWGALGNLRRSYRKAGAGGNAALREAVVTSAATLLRPADGLGDGDEPPAARAAAAEADATATAAERESFLQRYWRLRPKHLRTQREVAAAAGVHINTIAAIENGRARPQYRTVAKLAAAFGVSAEELMEGR